MVSPFIKKNSNIFLLLIPALIALIIALIPTLKYQWPLSWDIYYHVHMAKLYLENGIIFYDSLTYAPYGRPIYYPPLFHFLLASLSYLFKTDPFQVARFLQPVFSFFMVLSFSYIGYKFYGLSVGVLTGFFIFFTNAFNRSMLAIPETMALIFLPLAIYLYYNSLESRDYRYTVISGIIAGSTLLTHSLTASILVLIILVFTILLKIKHEKVIFNYFWIFLGVALVVASLWWIPLLLKYGYVFQNPLPVVLSAKVYLITFGKILGVPLIFAIIGLALLIKKRNNFEKKDILIISWFTLLILISSTYLLGVKILFDRILNFATLPLVILAALGINYFKINYGKKIYYILAFIMIAGAIFSGFSYAVDDKPMISSPEQDVGNWFNTHGDKKSVAVCLNSQIDPVIVSMSGQPVSAGGYNPGIIKHLDMDKYYAGTFTIQDSVNDHVGYIVNNVWAKNPPHSILVYQNKEYNIFVVENQNIN